jgi:hypothetical protein
MMGYGNVGMMGEDGIPALGGTADRRPAVDPTALPMLTRDEHSLVPPNQNLFHYSKIPFFQHSIIPSFLLL